MYPVSTFETTESQLGEAEVYQISIRIGFKKVCLEINKLFYCCISTSIYWQSFELVAGVQTEKHRRWLHQKLFSGLLCIHFVRVFHSE